MKQSILRYSCNAAFALLLTFAFAFNAKAQSPSPTALAVTPSCNLSGTLEARSRTGATGLPTEVVVLAKVGNTEANSTLTYSFASNTSGATIKSYGAKSYNAATKVTTQQITLIPGNPGKGFAVKLDVTNPSGANCNCSKSVTVIN